MSRVYPSIQGCPFRKIVSRKTAFNGIYSETLSCGHIIVSREQKPMASKRRCYSCKWDKEHKEDK